MRPCTCPWGPRGGLEATTPPDAPDLGLLPPTARSQRARIVAVPRLLWGNCQAPTLDNFFTVRFDLI